MNCENENFVQTPLNTYGPYLSADWLPAILNTEDTTVYFVTPGQNSEGLYIQSYNYTSGGDTPTNSSLIPSNIYSFGTKISENLVLVISQNGGSQSTSYNFEVYNTDSSQFIQNFTASFNNFQKLTNVYPHSVNLTSSLPVQSIILMGYNNGSSAFYEFSVNNTETQFLYQTEHWNYYGSIDPNSVVFYEITGFGFWNYEVLEYIGPIPVPQPPPNPNSGSTLTISLITLIGLLVFV